jgi:hypothetical protein
MAVDFVPYPIRSIGYDEKLVEIITQKNGIIQPVFAT